MNRVTFWAVVLGLIVGGLIVSTADTVLSNPRWSSNKIVTMTGDVAVFSDTAPGPAIIPTTDVVAYGTTVRATGTCLVRNEPGFGGKEEGILVQFEVTPGQYGQDRCLREGSYILLYKSDVDGSPFVFLVSQYWLPKPSSQ